MKVVALAGGVGGAKLADGLAQALPPEDLTIIVNTGDDFDHLGLRICPDLDTVCYTLAGLANPETGWGREGETWNALENLSRLGGPGWFRLGDRDLATHLERTRRLAAGDTLSQVTAAFCAAWGVGPRVLPMSDDPVPTIVRTDEGELPFQEYFVARRCEPRVTGFHFMGAAQAAPAPGVLAALAAADAVVICPSNPWVSIDPILNIPGVWAALAARPVVAVSPIVGGQALKGPAAKMYAELGTDPSAAAVAKHYRGLLAGFVLDAVDAGLVSQLDMPTLVADTIMKDRGHRLRLAQEVLEFAARLVPQT
jgi:LPPG:FO 2-phospho-L-lactate transferase